jgi:hypothetical protein
MNLFFLSITERLAKRAGLSPSFGMTVKLFARGRDRRSRKNGVAKQRKWRSRHGFPLTLFQRVKLHRLRIINLFFLSITERLAKRINFYLSFSPGIE